LLNNYIMHEKIILIMSNSVKIHLLLDIHAILRTQFKDIDNLDLHKKISSNSLKCILRIFPNILTLSPSTLEACHSD